MKRLILMRHAKSDWSAGATSDHARPLNTRGTAAAVALGDWLREMDITPDQVLCSDAQRTRDTCDGLALDAGVSPTFTRDLYLATHGEMMTALRGAAGDVVLMIGHNPGVSIVAAQILTTGPEHPDFERYPTGATLVADLAVDDWQDAAWGTAIARHFMVPRDL